MIKMDPLSVLPLLMMWTALTTNGMKNIGQDALQCNPCICQNVSDTIVATCANVFLESIPGNIPDNITQLILRSNDLTHLTDGMFSRFGILQVLDIFMNKLEHISFNAFLGLGHLVQLNLSENAIKNINPDIFAPLTSLSVLDISNNRDIGLTGIGNITLGVQNLPLRKLFMNRVVAEHAVCVIIKTEFIQNLQDTFLEEFHADQNSIELFGNEALVYFPKSLRKVSLKENKFTFGKYLAYITSLTGLEYVDLSGLPHAHELPSLDGLEWFTNEMQDCESDSDCDTSRVISSTNYATNYANIFPLHLIARGDGKITIPIPVPPKLKKLIYAYSQLPFHIGKLAFSTNTLEHVDMSSNILSTWSGPVTGLENITFLNLNNNVAKVISPDFFHTFPNLLTLNVSYNFMGNVLYNDSNGTVFLNQNRLQVLDLRSNFIPNLMKNVFKSLHSIRVLNLEGNFIHPNLDVELVQMTNLESLILRSNQIRWLPLHVRQSLSKLASKRKTNKLEVDLSQNPIACTCYNSDFLKWMLTPQINFGNLSNYYCLYSSGTLRPLDDLESVYTELEKSCHNYFGIYLGVVSLFVLTASLIVCSIGYRYRWKLRYWYYAARLRYSNTTESVNDPLFEFDVFVSFDDDDRDFVVNDLIMKLEVEAGLRLNIHQRNFRPGRPIAANIMEAVKRSKRTLFVLSRGSLQSYWCTYEFQMANMESVTTGRDVLMIIMYEQIPTRDIPAEILYHMQTDSYIEYPNEGDTDVFWRTLVESLNK
ncbi:toll-like receptor 4 isoform X2 [Haliotis rufescens]|uniref:toll-like receptor 4 isoform X2 n=1 Tax=Haliotis rufescens TaxID=6454 RepID=UPI00201F3EE8|nr:toll-like receptor 4 isoform X2 [Haliotis rufescens]